MPSADETPSDDVPLRPVQRTTAYGVVGDGEGGVLLRVPGGADPRGRWSLPGGVVRHGEHPRDRVRAGLLEQTGLRAATITPRDAGADLVELPAEGASVHTLRLLFDVTLPGRPFISHSAQTEPAPVSGPVDRLPGEDPAAEPDELPAPVAVVTAGPGPDERPVAQFVGRFVTPDELAELRLPGFLAEALRPGRILPEDAREDSAGPEPWVSGRVRGGIELLDPPIDPALLLEPVAVGDGEDVPVFVQRPAAYAVLVDETSGPRMLLSRLAGSENVWTLPGGGIDHGEHPRRALRREIHEEAGLPYTSGPLIDISSRHFVGRSPHLGRLEDFHAVRLIYAGSVPVDREPQVIEVDGSTEEAAWIPLADLDAVGAVPTAHDALAAWRAHRDGTPGEAPMDAAADARGDEMMKKNDDSA